MEAPLIILLVVLAFAGIAIASFIAERKRRERIEAFCRQQGLRYLPGNDSGFDERFGGFDFLRQGSRRYARHQMTGRSPGGHELLICEYHYETYSHDSKGRRQTHHHWSTLVLLRPPFPLRDLCIRREGLFDKLKGAFGWDDIDFASAEFSRKYHVSAPDRDWAFAVVQPETMDLLLRTEGVEFHMAQGWLALRVKRSLRVESLPGMIGTGERLIGGIPGFARKGAA